MEACKSDVCGRPLFANPVTFVLDNSLFSPTIVDLAGCVEDKMISVVVGSLTVIVVVSIMLVLLGNCINIPIICSSY